MPIRTSYLVLLGAAFALSGCPTTPATCPGGGPPPCIVIEDSGGTDAGVPEDGAGTDTGGPRDGGPSGCGTTGSVGGHCRGAMAGTGGTCAQYGQICGAVDCCNDVPCNDGICRFFTP